MKLLIVSHSSAVASNQSLYAEIQALTGWEVSLVIPARWKDEFGNTLDQEPLAPLRDRTRKVPVFLNGNIILHAYLQNWKKFLRQGNFDAIYVNHEPYAVSTGQVCWANLKMPRPVPFGFYSCQNIQKTYPIPFSAMEKMVYENSRFAFPITEAVADVLKAKGYTGALDVCALPVDIASNFPRGRAEDEALIPRKSGETVIGYVGRIVESKGLRTLAAALAQISDLSWKLALVGAGEFEKEFLSLMATNGLSERILTTGYIPHTDAPRYLSAIDILVLPSETQANWKEQFGRVITESLACGTAVIGSDSGEIPNLIRSSGGGLVFPERNAAEFAKALRTLVTDSALREKHAAEGRAWTLENVSLRGVATKMASTIEGCL